ERLTDLTAGRSLTSEGFIDFGPSWTPDGRGILFASNRRGTDSIWKLSLDPANLVRLTSGSGKSHMPRISPDGRWVALSLVREKGQTIYVMRADGSDLHLLDTSVAEEFASAFHADWSPHGSRLAAVSESRAKGVKVRIASMNSETGTAREIEYLDLAGALPNYPRWSPDGRSLVYEAVAEGSWDLWMVGADGRNPRRLTSDPGNERSAAWSHD